MQNGIVAVEDHFAVAYKTEVFPYNSSITLLGIYLIELKVYVHTHMRMHTYARMFIKALFIITKNFKQPICPSIDECINELRAPMQLSVIQWYKEINCQPTKKTQRNHK